MRRYTFRIVICSSERTIEILGGDKGAAPSRRSKTKDKIALVFARRAPCRSGPYVTNCRSCSVNDIHSGDAEKKRDGCLPGLQRNPLKVRSPQPSFPGLT